MTFLPIPGPRKSSFGRPEGVHLNSRAKDHLTVPNECPEHMPYCKCEKKRRGLDINCDRVNFYKLKLACDELRKVGAFSTCAREGPYYYHFMYSKIKRSSSAAALTHLVAPNEI